MAGGSGERTGGFAIRVLWSPLEKVLQIAIYILCQGDTGSEIGIFGREDQSRKFTNEKSRRFEPCSSH